MPASALAQHPTTGPRAGAVCARAQFRGVYAVVAAGGDLLTHDASPSAPVCGIALSSRPSLPLPPPVVKSLSELPSLVEVAVGDPQPVLFTFRPSSLLIDYYTINLSAHTEVLPCLVERGGAEAGNNRNQEGQAHDAPSQSLPAPRIFQRPTR